MNTQSSDLMIEKLLEAQICFALVVSQSTFRVPHLDISGKDIFLIVAEKDTQTGFEKSQTIPGLLEYNMSEDEFDDFKSNHLDKFQKVQHSSEGRVYELKQNSFLEYFHNQTDK